MNEFIQKQYFNFLMFLKPFIEYVGSFYFKFSSKEHIFARYDEIVEKLEPGDLILTHSDGHLSNLLNRGYWKHAVVFIGFENGKPMVMEAIGKGVVKRTLAEMLSSKDRIKILRPTKKLVSKKSQIKVMIKWAKEQEGKPYDYKFDLFSKKSGIAFYCSEFYYKFILSGNPKAQFNLRESFGIKTATPVDLDNMSKVGKFIVVLEINRK